MATCANCDKPFSFKRKQLGYDICIKCAERYTKKYIGRRTGKHGDTEIFRTDQAHIRSILKRENRIGPKPSIPILTPSIIDAQERWAGRGEDE